MTVVTSDNRYGTAQLIVAPTLAQGANYTTIASAITAAVAGNTIFIRPGTYTENITLKAGVNLAAFGGDGIAGATNSPNVIILGTCTFTYSGSASITGIQLKTNSAAAIATSGSNTGTLELINCEIDGSNATAITMNNINSIIDCRSCKCQTESNNLLYAVTAGNIVFRSCDVQSGTAANTIASGVVNMFNSTFAAYSITTSSTGSFTSYNSFFTATNQTIFTLAGTGTAIVEECSLFSGTASTISIGTGCTCSVSNCQVSSSNTNVITGLGTLNYGELVFGSSSSGINVTTQNIFNTGPIIKSAAQPIFSVYLSSNQANATGDGTVYSIIHDSTLVNIGTSYSTSTGLFTAPRTGNYLFTYTNAYSSLGVAAAIVNYFNGSVVRYRADQAGSGALLSGGYISSGSIMIPMTAGDTIGMQAQATATTKTVSVAGAAINSGGLLCSFAGYYLP